jgi:predicted amidophosphoribosyltransferase
MIDTKTYENLNTFFNGLKYKKNMKYKETFIKKLLYLKITELHYTDKPEGIDRSLIEKSDIIIINFKEKHQGELKNKIIYKSDFQDDEDFIEQISIKIKKYCNLYLNKDYSINKNPIITIGYVVGKNILIINLQEIEDVGDSMNLYISNTEFCHQLDEMKKLEEEKEKVKKEKIQRLKISRHNNEEVSTEVIKKPYTYIDDGFAEKIIYNKYIDIYHLDFYDTKTIYDETKHKKVNNPSITKYSQYISDFKYNLNIDFLVKYFTDKLIYVFDKEFMNEFKIPDYITCEPSHISYNINDNMNKIINNLCDKFGSQNACGGLQRIKTIEKLSYGGKRDIKVHFDSINLNINKLQYNINQTSKIVYVIDDVITTGHSLNACKEILEMAGYNVRCIALGKTRN